MLRTHPWLTRWREVARKLKRDVTMLYYAVLEPRTPWYAKALIIIIVAYALSPIDLIPDAIPILGYLDDLILLPLGIWFALQIIPPPIIEEARLKAADTPHISNLFGLGAAIVIILIYGLVAFWIYRYITRLPQ